MNISTILSLAISLAALWHVVGFAFGLVYVRFCFLSLLGRKVYNPLWSRVVRTADLHLWLSGVLLIALGAAQKGAALYFDNPKLWCKLTVVVVWMVSTQLMRHIGIPRLKQGHAGWMRNLSCITLSCWLYGAFLGCAKPLANGVVSYPLFLIGFMGLVALSFAVLQRMETSPSRAA